MCVNNFPVHMELRQDTDGTLLPIEVNSMRFGGWCTTADLSFLSYGCNPYLYYYAQKKPNWSKILKGKEGRLFSVMVLDNSTGVDGDKIESFNYEKLVIINILSLVFLFTKTCEDNFIEFKNLFAVSSML